jgi:hypothetical protein
MTTEFIRRRVLAGADACLLLAPAIAAPEEGKKGKKAGEQKEVGAVEDLMREHGVLRRAQVRGHRKAAIRDGRIRAGGQGDRRHRATPGFRRFGSIHAIPAAGCRPILSKGRPWPAGRAVAQALPT